MLRQESRSKWLQVCSIGCRAALVITGVIIVLQARISLLFICFAVHIGLFMLLIRWFLAVETPCSLGLVPAKIAHSS